MAEELKIVLAVDGADKVATALDNTSDALKDTANEAKKAGDALNKTLKPGASQATNALGNLSRIAQDAPFGFIGITNNINPMLESFQRLQTETGSVGAALKAMVQGLAGPAGLGLAVGVVSSLLVTFGGDLFKGKKQVEEFDNSINLLVESLNKAGDGFKNLENVSTFALELAGIDLSIKYDKDDQVKAISGAQKYIELAQLRDEAELAYNNALKKRSSIDFNAIKNQEDLKRVQDAANKSVSEALDNYVKYNKLTFLQGKQNKLLDIQEKRAAAERLKNLDTIEKTLAALREARKDASNVAIALDTQSIDAQIKLITSAIDKLITKFNIDPDSAIILQLKADIDELELRKSTVKFKDVWQNASDRLLKGGLTVKVTPQLPDIKTLAPTLKDYSNTLQNAFESIAVNVGQKFGETLGLALIGQATLGDVFSGIFEQLAGGVEALGKQLIEIGTLAVIAQSAISQLLLNPFAAIAVGIALTALGSAMKGLMNKQRFAVGTRFAPGGMALVGERGPEMVSLPRGSQVVPAAQTSAMLGGRQQVEVVGVLRGQDIYFSNKKYSQTYNRQT